MGKKPTITKNTGYKNMGTDRTKKELIQKKVVITKKGQIRVPSVIRKNLDIKRGDTVYFWFDTMIISGNTAINISTKQPSNSFKVFTTEMGASGFTIKIGIRLEYDLEPGDKVLVIAERQSNVERVDIPKTITSENEKRDMIGSSSILASIYEAAVTSTARNFKTGTLSARNSNLKYYKFLGALESEFSSNVELVKKIMSMGSSSLTDLIESKVGDISEWNVKKNKIISQNDVQNVIDLFAVVTLDQCEPKGSNDSDVRITLNTGSRRKVMVSIDKSSENLKLNWIMNFSHQIRSKLDRRYSTVTKRDESGVHLIRIYINPIRKRVLKMIDGLTKKNGLPEFLQPIINSNLNGINPATSSNEDALTFLVQDKISRHLKPTKIIPFDEIVESAIELIAKEMIREDCSPLVKHFQTLLAKENLENRFDQRLSFLISSGDYIGSIEYGRDPNQQSGSLKVIRTNFNCGNETDDLILLEDFVQASRLEYALIEMSETDPACTYWRYYDKKYCAQSYFFPWLLVGNKSLLPGHSSAWYSKMAGIINRKVLFARVRKFLFSMEDRDCKFYSSPEVIISKIKDEGFNFEKSRMIFAGKIFMKYRWLVGDYYTLLKVIGEKIDLQKIKRVEDIFMRIKNQQRITRLASTIDKSVIKSKAIGLNGIDGSGTKIIHISISNFDAIMWIFAVLKRGGIRLTGSC
ncbi:MAG: hypothetical protein ACXAEU_01460 [Candidatus Hodarchaeales archaeon]|jgi:AbrB family looped-hinge helix DNA binding protein